jgi:hypothetical protein
MVVGHYKYSLEAGRNADMPPRSVNFSVEPDYAHLADYHFGVLIIAGHPLHIDILVAGR